MEAKFSYDRYGNRTGHEKFIGATQITLDNTTHPTIDANTNRFAANQGYLFDKNGNLTTDPSYGGRHFVFNGDNKQKEVRDANNNLVGEYFYDGEGKRVKKHVYNGGVLNEITIFVYSAGKLIAEYSTALPPQNPTTNWTVTDQLGSPRVLVNSLGEVVSRRDFMPFGEELFPDGTHRTTNLKYTYGDNVRQKFTGYQKDEETQLDFAEARMYENRHARFTAVDPLLASGKSANPQTFNRYVYVMNNPLAYTDPTGLQATTHVNPCPDSNPCSDYSWTKDPADPTRAQNDRITANKSLGYVEVFSAYVTSALAEAQEYFASQFSDVSGSDPLQNLNYQRFEAVRSGDGEALNQRLFGFLGPRNFDTLQATTDSFKAAETIGNANLTFQFAYSGVANVFISGNGSTVTTNKGFSIGGQGNPFSSGSVDTFPSIKPGASGGPTTGQRFSSSVRAQAFAENPSRICVFCRQPNATQIDHANPMSRGGNATIENAQLTCSFCNPSKGIGSFPKNPAPGYKGPFPPPWWKIQW